MFDESVEVTDVSTMFHNTLWLYIQMSFCTISILCCLFVLPQIYVDIHDLHDFVFESVNEFKHDVDAAWTQLMEIQSKLNDQIDRFKRYDSPPPTGREREDCNCGEMAVCTNPGPPGPPGVAGINGENGEPGQPGVDAVNYPVRHYDEILANIPPRCIICPSPPGPEGLPGYPGPPVKCMIGAPGLDVIVSPAPPIPLYGYGYATPGYVTPPTYPTAPPVLIPGPQGEPGDPGPDGCRGPDGADGLRGKSFVLEIGTPGAKGPRGEIGLAGPKDNERGDDGEEGVVGEVGRRGIKGKRGMKGKKGKVGRPGKRGDPGDDAGYCQCPIMTRELQKITTFKPDQYPAELIVTQPPKRPRNHD